MKKHDICKHKNITSQIPEWLRKTQSGLTVSKGNTVRTLRLLWDPYLDVLDTQSTSVHTAELANNHFN
jgi:hypothetical protein